MPAGSLLIVLVLMVAAAPAAGQTSERGGGSRTGTDQTLQVPRGTRLDLDDCRGEVLVRTWDREAVRVQARHAARTRVRADLVGTQLRVDVDSDRGESRADLTISAPSWLSLRIDGNQCSADVSGLGGAVSVDTVDGDIRLSGLTGTVDAESVSGTITLDGGAGRVQLSTVDGNITVTRAAGGVVAESVNGDITLIDTQATSVELSTVDGDIAFGGTLAASGRYAFTTHDGNVVLTIPESSSATFTVRSFGGGRIDATMPLRQTSSGRRGQRATYTLGSGSAQVDIEIFDGDVRIRRPGDARRN